MLERDFLSHDILIHNKPNYCWALNNCEILTVRRDDVKYEKNYLIKLLLIQAQSSLSHLIFFIFVEIICQMYLKLLTYRIFSVVCSELPSTNSRKSDKFFVFNPNLSVINPHGSV